MNLKSYPPFLPNVPTMDRECKGCLDYETDDKYKHRCLAPGIGSRHNHFKQYICPCVDCLLKMICSIDHRSLPYPCKLYRTARSVLFQELYGNMRKVGKNHEEQKEGQEKKLHE